MKFVSYIYNNIESYGIVTDNGNSVIPMNLILKKINKEILVNLLSFIEKYSNSITEEINNVLDENEFDVLKWKK